VPLHDPRSDRQHVFPATGRLFPYHVGQGCLLKGLDRDPSTFHEAIGRRSFRQPAASSPTTWARNEYSMLSTRAPSTRWARTEYSVASTSTPSTTWARTDYLRASTRTPPRPGQRSAEGLSAGPPPLPGRCQDSW
jgi:hypothetical protein